MIAKCEIGCLTCNNYFSVNNGEDEINFRCPVCTLKFQLQEIREEYGNSDGNRIAQAALAKIKAILDGM